MATVRPTIFDVAKAVGASHTSVSLALRGSPRVSESRRLKIRQIAESLGYEPSVAARLLRSKQTGQVGLIIPAGAANVSESSFAGPILTEFVKACEAEQLRYHIEYLTFSSETDVVRPHQFVGGLVDGAIVAGWLGDATRKWLQENAAQYPVVTIDEEADRSVISATGDGIYDAVRHLSALGHRRIAYIGGTDDYGTFRLGLDGYRRAVADFNLDPSLLRQVALDDLIDRPRSMLKAVQFFNELFSLPERPSAIVCHSSPIARAIIYQATKAGLDVPADLSVIGFGTQADAEKGLPLLSSVESDFHEIVPKAIALLRRCIAGQPIADKTLWVRPKLVDRDTVARFGS